MVVVADVALAHQQAGEIFERVLAVGGVDALLDLLVRDALHGGGDLRRQRGRLAAGDGDDAQFFDGCIGGLCPGGQADGEGDGHGQGNAGSAHSKTPEIKQKSPLA
ncbi:hypothetical protein, partial [Stenotrophomonas sp. YIM B06876]|uniref:hypothetical protein n=1 Tax=Stenotrophomonas sp. YIM B06876 TaxID=3060211 RepID=UPI002738EEBA